ncbi:nucleoside-diphosphate-sugar epimerase [Streptomonospora nanhaiensis]|uniref:Nucleoside-diphosphate-sugar epimerase n=1 Tax=Streptomonospora nanhaiensis TaxID=1323731 RepID=A0A853BNB6_9ACTN|nr:NAD(P)-dependent oxidoreductase [Streptomonospora nanhaiensis]NYI97109.1 nucleoside-diphosphate-sugar epimerase [Streptomonospora nanhaiensis]
MRVLLAGATGSLGRALLPRLVAAGHSVVALTRRPASAERIRAARVQPVVADVMDADGLARALEGQHVDAVVHQATAITGVPLRHRDLAATDALRDAGTRNLMRAAESTGAKRFVTQSFFLGYGWRDHGTRPLTEEDPFAVPDGGAFDGHLRSLRSNEDQVLGAAGLEGVALRYGLFYGRDPSTLSMMRLARRRLLPAPRRAAVLHPVHIEDAAEATVAALHHGGAGRAYNIADDTPVGMDVFLDHLAAAAGAPRPVRVPGALLRPAPYLHSLLVSTRIRLDCGRAAAELGWRPRYASCAEGLAAVAARPAEDAG